MAFNPDEYIKKNIKNFDPDEYIKNNSVKEEQGIFSKALSEVANRPQESLKEAQTPGYGQGLVKASMEALPMAGSIAGAGLGLASPIPGGAIAGAGLGSALGESARQIGNKYLLDEKPEGVSEIAKQGLLGAGAEMGGQAVGKAVNKGIESITPALQKGGEWLTGIPKKAIETYQKYRPEVEELFKKHEGNFATMADEARANTNNALFAKKAELNKIIDSSLKNSDAMVNVIPIQRALIDAQTHLDPLVPTDKKQIDQINDLLTQIKNGTQNGKEMPVQRANRFKASFQELASQSYAKPGEIYNLGSDAARAAKKAASEIRTQINQALPDLAEANNTHAKLHDLEDLMNSNLIAEGKPEAALLAAGSGANQRNAKVLKDLGKIIDHDALGEAEKISAARYFGDPSLSPVDVTGKALERTSKAKGIGAAIGSGLGFLSGGAIPAMAGGAIGREAGGYIASPLSLKGGIIANDLINQGANVLNRELPQITRPLTQGGARIGRGLLNKGVK
jgi:hypothetical protein